MINNPGKLAIKRKKRYTVQKDISVCGVQYLGEYSKWFEPRSISSSCSVIVQVTVVLKRTIGDSD